MNLRSVFFGDLAALRSPDPSNDPDSFGNIAIELGMITKEQLAKAIRIQEKKLPLGEILVEIGVLTETQREEILIEQERRKLDKTTTGHKAAFEMRRQRAMMRQMRNGLSEIQEQTTQFVATLAVAQEPKKEPSK